MAQYVIDKRDFLKGMALSEELGGFWSDMQGINLFSQRGIGIFQPANRAETIASEASGTALGSPITCLIQTPAATNVWGLSNTHHVNIIPTGDNAETATITAFAGGDVGDKRGACAYKLGFVSSTGIGAATTGIALFYAFDTDIGVRNLSAVETEVWNSDFMSTVPANNANVTGSTFRVMYHHKRHDILYWNDANKVDKYDANVPLTSGNGTLTKNCLDLPVDWEIRDFGQLRDYLAILATTPKRDENTPYIRLQSKVFFWDGISDSWIYETPVINDQIIKLKNTEEGLFAIGKGDGISYYQIELEQARRIFNWSGSKNPIDITAGRRDASDLANYGAVTSIGNQIMVLGKDGSNAHIFSVGNRFAIGSTRTINKSNYLKSATSTGVVDLGDLVAVSPTKFYASYHDDNGAGTDQYRIVRFSSGNRPTDDGKAETVELDSYFGGTGRLKRLNYIRIDTDPLTSGDVLELYKELDYTGSWTRIDGGSSAGATNAVRYADLPSETSTKFSVGDLFRHLRLRLDPTGGCVKVRRIIVDFDYAE